MSFDMSKHAHRKLKFCAPLRKDEVVHPTVLVRIIVFGGSKNVILFFQNLLRQCYKVVSRSQYPVATVIRLQGTLSERLELRETFSTISTNIKCSSGALLWLVRHYIGLLPIQILPKRINDVKYVWSKLAKECQNALHSGCSVKPKEDVLLTHKVTSEMLRLPPSHISLIMTLLHFLRALAVLPFDEPNVDKKSLYSLVRYFSGSIFVRPFCPGADNKNELQYLPLLVYMILNWATIYTIVFESSDYSPQLFSSYRSNANPVRTKMTHNCAIQTIAQEQKIIRIIPDWYENCDFVKDNFCQTNFDTKEPIYIGQQFYGKKDKITCTKNDQTSFDVHEKTASSSDKANTSSPYGDYNSTLQKSIRPLLKNPRQALAEELKQKVVAITFKRKKEEINGIGLINSEKTVDKSEECVFVKDSLENICTNISTSKKNLVQPKKFQQKFEFFQVLKNNFNPRMRYVFNRMKNEVEYEKMATG
ncbi:hypothetical protein FQA39_LY17027 [Lamprigera yunnana]|nr:hypothetical protein FQA39_LY17027 [Lamprigera yunnana]